MPSADVSTCPCCPCCPWAPCCGASSAERAAKAVSTAAWSQRHSASCAHSSRKMTWGGGGGGGGGRQNGAAGGTCGKACYSKLAWWRRERCTPRCLIVRLIQILHLLPPAEPPGGPAPFSLPSRTAHCLPLTRPHFWPRRPCAAGSANPTAEHVLRYALHCYHTADKSSALHPHLLVPQAVRLRQRQPLLRSPPRLPVTPPAGRQRRRPLQQSACPAEARQPGGTSRGKHCHKQVIFLEGQPDGTCRR